MRGSGAPGFFDGPISKWKRTYTIFNLVLIGRKIYTGEGESYHADSQVQRRG